MSGTFSAAGFSKEEPWPNEKPKGDFGCSDCVAAGGVALGSPNLNVMSGDLVRMKGPIRTRCSVAVMEMYLTLDTNFAALRNANYYWESRLAKEASQASGLVDNLRFAG